VAAGESISFQGSAIDPEDGPLTGSHLVWSSDLEGEIGTGAGFTSSTLSVGSHTITLTATDPQGATGSASVGVALQEVQKGSIELTVSSNGQDVPLAYTAVLGGTESKVVDCNGSVTFTDLAPDTYSLELRDVPENCQVTGENPVSVTVEAGNARIVAMNVECSQSQLDQLVFTRSLPLAEFAISMINVDGTDFVQLADSGFATDVSSDGTKILYITLSNNTGNAVWQMSADGSNPVQLTAETGVYSLARWSPDGSKIAYAYRTIGGIDTDSEIWVMNADGSEPVQLTNNQGFTDFQPAWSPDGSKIAFVSTRDGDYEIYTMDADGANPMRLTNDFAEDLTPDWSPDGSKIAFGSNRGPDIQEIWVMNADGSNAAQLTTGLSVGSGVDPWPAWSPDGSRIAFSARMVDQLSYNLGVMNADGSGIVQVTAGSNDHRPRWKPQGP